MRWLARWLLMASGRRGVRRAATRGRASAACAVAGALLLVRAAARADGLGCCLTRALEERLRRVPPAPVSRLAEDSQHGVVVRARDARHQLREQLALVLVEQRVG